MDTEIFEIVRFLLILVVNSMFIAGLHYAFSYDEVTNGPYVATYITNENILWRVHFFVKEVFGLFWSKPIAGCMTCMSSIWSLPVFLYFCPITFELLWLEYPSFLLPLPIVHNLGLFIIYVPALAGLNRIVSRWL